MTNFFPPFLTQNFLCIRLVDPSTVPAANKAFAPPWAQADEVLQPSRWSSEYHERFAFGEQWYQHMRPASSKGASTKEGGEVGGGALEQMTVDSLLLPWDAAASNRAGRRQEHGVSDVMEFDDDTADNAVTNEVAAFNTSARGQTVSNHKRYVTNEHAQSNKGGDMARHEQRHRPSGRALAWQDDTPEEPTSGYRARDGGQVGTLQAATRSKLIDTNRIVSDCLENALAPAKRTDLDVQGVASSKATLSQEPYIRHRGAGTHTHTHT